MRDDCAADPSAISFLWGTRATRCTATATACSCGGYGALVELLATGLDVRLEQVVQTIRYNGDSDDAVRVTTDRGAFEADTVL